MKEVFARCPVCGSQAFRWVGFRAPLLAAFRSPLTCNFCEARGLTTPIKNWAGMELLAVDAVIIGLCIVLMAMLVMAVLFI